MAFGLDDAIAAGLQVINKFVPDPNAKIQAEKDLRDSLQAWDHDQTQINAIEAANPNVFVSGWRPAIGWIGVLGLFYQYVGRPIIVGMGYPDFIALDDSINQLVFAMLGLGGLRTYEKVKGIASK